MKTAIAALLLAVVLAPASAFADKTILDNKQTSTIDCAKDPAVAITGNDNEVALTGPCTKVAVSGNHNKVAIAQSTEVSVTGNENSVAIVSVDSLSVPGNKNVVTWKTSTAKDGKAKVSNTGTANKVSQSK